MKKSYFAFIAVLLIAAALLDGQSRWRGVSKQSSSNNGSDDNVCEFCLTSPNEADANNNLFDPALFESTFAEQERKKDAGGGDQPASSTSK